MARRHGVRGEADVGHGDERDSGQCPADERQGAMRQRRWLPSGRRLPGVEHRQQHPEREQFHVGRQPVRHDDRQ